MIKLRNQEHAFGCGLACVAMIANVPYMHVRYDYDELFGSPERIKCGRSKALDYGTHAVDLHCLLCLHDIESSIKLLKFKSWDKLPDIAIMMVYKPGHWVVFDRKQNVVLDPWPKYKDRSQIRTDYKRLKPKGYVGVYL